MRTAAEAPRPPVQVTGERYADVLRELDEQNPTSPGYRELRDAAARYEAARGMDRINDGDTEGALRSLRVALVHYTPEDLGRGGLPTEIGTLARALLEELSPRGDEAHALAANRVLAATAPPDPNAMQRFREINDWGDNNRAEFEMPWVHLGEMADIYKEVARIVPAPDILRRTVELLIARRRAAQEAQTRRMPPGRRMTFEDMQQLQSGLRNTAADLAVVFLRMGDLEGAAEAVAQLPEGAEGTLAMALRSLANGEGGSEALLELASRIERVDPAAAEGICRRGRRQYPQEPRFANCLAVAAVRERNFALASSHLEAAVRLAPQDPSALRVALEAAANWLMRESGNEDPGPGRHAYRRARALLDEWNRRFPRQPAPVTAGDIEEAAAQLELGQANVRAAEEHLERAAHHEQPPSRDAYLTLAEIAQRRGDPRRAFEILQQGLDLPVRPTEADSTFRPAFLLRMGLAAQAAGDEQNARQLLTSAEAAFDALTRSLENLGRAHAFYYRAIALDALGRHDEVRPALNAAMDAAPEAQDLLAKIITFEISRGAWDDALTFDRMARGQLNLDRTWQVYFGLWGSLAYRVGHLESDGGAGAALESIARSARAHSPWTVRLAQRYTGALNREELMRYATSPGQRAEASFYEAMLELAQGDLASAERDLRQVLATDMLRYFEYEMAAEMLQRGLQRVLAGPGAARAGAPANGSAPAAGATAQPLPSGPTSSPSPRPGASRSTPVMVP